MGEDSIIGDLANDWYFDRKRPRAESFTRIFNYYLKYAKDKKVIKAFIESYKEYIDFIYVEEFGEETAAEF